MKLLTDSNEDYLEAIYILRMKKGKVRSVDISNMLNVSKPYTAPPTHKDIIALNSVKMLERVSIANNLPKKISFLEIGLMAKYRIEPSLISPAIEWQASIIE